MVSTEKQIKAAFEDTRAAMDDDIDSQVQEAIHQFDDDIFFLLNNNDRSTNCTALETSDDIADKSTCKSSTDAQSTDENAQLVLGLAADDQLDVYWTIDYMYYQGTVLHVDKNQLLSVSFEHEDLKVIWSSVKKRGAIRR